MEALIRHIKEEWATVSTAPFTFIILAILISGLAYYASSWKFSAVIVQLETTIETHEATIENLKERVVHKSELAESYKERAFKYDAKLLEVVDATENSLVQKSLEFVSDLRNFIKNSKLNDGIAYDQFRSEMRKAKTEEEKNRLWDKNTGALIRRHSNTSYEYERRFKVDAILLRDELRSRLKVYQPLKNFRETSYEYPTNYFGYNDVATDIERMAKLLSTGNKSLD